MGGERGRECSRVSGAAALASLSLSSASRRFANLVAFAVRERNARDKDVELLWPNVEMVVESIVAVVYRRDARFRKVSIGRPSSRASTHGRKEIV